MDYIVRLLKACWAAIKAPPRPPLLLPFDRRRETRPGSARISVAFPHR